VRTEVFVHEQGVPLELERDEEDPHSDHVMAVNRAGEIVGTARLLRDGHIGRMAVLRPWRGCGIGSATLQRLVDRARQIGLSQVDLNAQSYAVPFYERLGFVVIGETFMDAGIPHRPMRHRIQDAASKPVS